MQTLYESDSFAVLHIQAASPTEPVAGVAKPDLMRHGFEIVDKRSGKEIYLDGSWAQVFQAQIEAWRENTPSQEEVEEKLEELAQLAHTPVSMH